MKVQLAEQQTNSFENGLMITDQRSNELCEMMSQLHLKEIEKEKDLKKATKLAERFALIAEKCENINEVIFCICTDTLFLVNTKVLVA